MGIASVVKKILNRAGCGESSVMFIEGVPPTAMWDSLCCEAIKKENPATVLCDPFQIDIYLQEASPLVLPSRCK